MQGLAAQRPFSALHTLASAADSMAPAAPNADALTLPMAHRAALAQAGQRSAPQRSVSSSAQESQPHSPPMSGNLP